MQKNIIVKIADNLTAQQEIAAIATAIADQQIKIGSRGKIAIGNRPIDGRFLETTITVKREPSEPYQQLIVCNCCNAQYDKAIGKPLWINYGGRPKQILYCSDECREVVISMIPDGRCAIKKTKLQTLRFW